MIDAPYALAFTAGMVATVNPCGFAMLPAYLGYFLGSETAGTALEAQDTTTRLLRALLVGTAVSAGFLLLFAVAGVLSSSTSFVPERFSPWLTVGIGALLVVGGGAFVAGWEPRLALPRLDKGGRDRGLWSMFLFGISYAVASLSCTIGPFTSVVAGSFRRNSFASGVATFMAYAAGMALLLMVLTVTLALAREGLVTWLRRSLPYVHRASGVIMLLMGAYLVWYGIYEIRLVNNGGRTGRGPVRWVTDWSGDVSSRLDRLDATTVALVLAMVVTSVVFVALLRAGRTQPRDDEAGTTSRTGPGTGSTPNPSTAGDHAPTAD